MLRISNRDIRIYSAITLFLVLVFQGYLLFILLSKPDVLSSPLIMFGHATISVLATIIFAQLVPNIFHKPCGKLIFFYFGCIFLLPMLGILVLSLVYLPRLYHIGPPKQPFKVKLNTIPPLPIATPEVSLKRCDSDRIPLCLLNSEDPKKRLEALIQTKKVQDKDAVPFLKQALLDPAKEIRLLAKALIDQKTEIINQRIDKQLNSKQPADCLFFQHIVSDYWELVRSDLVEGGSVNNVLIQALNQVYTGLERYPENAMLHFQLARLLLHNKQLKEAKTEFEKAQNLGVDEKKLLPYFAEIAFSKRRFDLVARLMRDIKVPNSHWALTASAGYWQKL